jgi:hypothetical protein
MSCACRSVIPLRDTNTSWCTSQIIKLHLNKTSLILTTLYDRMIMVESWLGREYARLRLENEKDLILGELWLQSSLESHREPSSHVLCNHTVYMQIKSKHVSWSHSGLRWMVKTNITSIWKFSYKSGLLVFVAYKKTFRCQPWTSLHLLP